MSRPTLTLFCGPPGAGKTTLARLLEAQGRGIRLCTDDWQYAITGGYDLAIHGPLQSVLFAHAQVLLRAGVDVILEDGLWTPPERVEKIAAGRAAGARIAMHIFDVPREVLRERLASRADGAEPGTVPVPDADLDVILTLFQLPTPAELDGVDEVHIHR